MRDSELEKVKRAREEYIDKEIATVTDYKNVFGSKQGKRVLAHLMSQNFMYETTFTTSLHEMALREGARNVVMQILNKLETHPEEIRELIRGSVGNG